MSVSYTPVTWWSGYSSDATNLKVTWAELDGVSDGEDDIREILLALLNETVTHKDTLTGGDIPTKFDIFTNNVYDEADNEIEYTFTVKFVMTPTTTLASE